MESEAFDIEAELGRLPDAPGVYIMRGAGDEILYVGKAVSLRRRVRQYFRSPTGKSARILSMITHIERFEYRVTESEEEALLLENDLIKRWQPKYNTLLKDDKTYPYIRVTLPETYPRLTLARKKEDDGSAYFGPYTQASKMRDVMALASRIFRLRQCSSMPSRPCLYYWLGSCMGPCTGEIDHEVYMRELGRAVDFLQGRYSYVERYLRHEMRSYSESLEYEKAMEMRDLLRAIGALRRSGMRSSAASPEAMKELSLLLDLPALSRIESYDISDISGTHSVGAMVVYLDGAPLRSDYRKFRIKSVRGPDDYASMREVLRRRFAHARDDSFPPLPGLILMDGGKGQVAVALEVLGEYGLDIPVAGMVKDERHRTRGLIYLGAELAMDPSSPAFRMVTGIQDETHRCAVEYHRKIRSGDAISSELGGIRLIGPSRERALLRHFGSVDIIKNKDVGELMEVPGMSEAAARSVYEYFRRS